MSSKRKTYSLDK
ncbi:0eed8f0b-070b-42f2-b41a-d913e25957b5 [Thermothielavioides terrestris]|uniref:0eed8f0b-070b-42f2-b41a-d913e25957b5 n=1 Tax=Thermothielavioides terrestris TaxID=2587410 RepID=A0A3S4CYU5_9PEZI|nr:0eed8f0b-070b-42f2-b41a-d913e25957b5 [Thermothielavioides terrestris]